MNISQDSEKTKVVFRWWRGGVIALFPEEPSDINGYYCSSYEQIGQHSGADYEGIIRNSRRATFAEATPLYIELEGIGYKIEVVQKCTPAMRRKRMETARSYRQDGWARLLFLAPTLLLVSLYCFVAGRLWGYVTTEIVKSFGG